MDQDTFQAGMAMRRQLFGGDPEKQLSEAGFDRNFQELQTQYCFGELWANDILTPKQRSFVVLSMLIGLDRPEQIKLHIRTAFRNGVTTAELEQILLHAMVYCGLPFSVEAFKIAKQVMAEMAAESSGQL